MVRSSPEASKASYLPEYTKKHGRQCKSGYHLAAEWNTRKDLSVGDCGAFVEQRAAEGPSETAVLRGAAEIGMGLHT